MSILDNIIENCKDLKCIGKGTYGVIMRKKTEDNYYVIKQFRVENYDDGSTSYDREVNIAKMAYNINNEIFIKIINNYKSEINLAKQIGINVPLINCVSVNNFGYIHMEYMEEGDLYKFLKINDCLDLTGILGCYLSALNILHNQLKIIHGDLTPNNLLVHYVGPNYRQKIVINDDIHYIDTNGFCYKITDFGLAEHIEATIFHKFYMNHIYRDYLLLFFLYFNKKRFYNYEKYINIIEIPLEQIYKDLHDGYNLNSRYIENFIEVYNYNSVCNFMNKYLEINLDNPILYDIPNTLLIEFIEVILYN